MILTTKILIVIVFLAPFVISANDHTMEQPYIDENTEANNWPEWSIPFYVFIIAVRYSLADENKTLQGIPCAGTIIHTQFILTAAVCIYDPKYGEYNDCSF